MLETWRQLIWLVPELDVGEIWPDNPLVRVDSWCSSQQNQKKTTDSDHLTFPKLITTSASILKRCSGIKVVQEPCDTGGGRAPSQPQWCSPAEHCCSPAPTFSSSPHTRPAQQERATTMLSQYNTTQQARGRCSLHIKYATAEEGGGHNTVLLVNNT